MTVTVRRADDSDLATFVAIRNAVTPEWGTSLEEVSWIAATYPGGVWLLAWDDGRPVGAGNAGRILVLPADHPVWWAEITVLPDARGRGAGAALLAGLSRRARASGKDGFNVPVSEGRPEGIRFLARRGYTEHERSTAVRLDLRGTAAGDAPQPPAGIRLVTLAERPDLVPAVHRVALETFPGIPGGEPMQAGDLDEFCARDVDRPGIRRDGFWVALEGDEVVGYASIVVDLGRPTIGIHDMTAVRVPWRGRGVATALKRATIDWARASGLEALETGNDVDNAPMRAVNERLGYRPMPDLIFMRGPLVPEALP